MPSLGHPYIGYGAVISFAEEIQKSEWVGYRRIIKIFPYADETAGSFATVERLASQIEAALHEQPIYVASDSEATTEADANTAFTCVFAGSADGDRTDGLLGAATRGLRFAVYRQPGGVAEQTGVPSAELAALIENTSAQLGADWQVYADRWQSAWARPCVLWRLSGSRKVTAKPSAYDVRRTYTAHVLGRTPAEEREALSLLAERFSSAPRLAPTVPGRRGATIADLNVDLEVDAFLKGQLRLDVLERVAEAYGRPVEPEPAVLMGSVGLKQTD
ncbi:hypothetical protein [Saccharibacillus sp. JS10]|uniref:hypothetical protein n=1 Tax=Saccharibacillus sp. JS10 TaxID=2950552 RepID=UPI00210A6609|nr:hypothetical protein [Saccharibacillus sp. JS10]MCQ4086672.1 hypothetical protein [Saccharibacillus sp. JS10]